MATKGKSDAREQEVARYRRGLAVSAAHGAGPRPVGSLGGRDTHECHVGDCREAELAPVR